LCNGSRIDLDVFMVGIFSDIESQISQQFVTKFGQEVGVCNQLLKVYEAFLSATSGKVKDNDFPKWTNLMFLSQTLPLMNNALYLLSKGYLRSSESLIRIAAEGMVMSAYFLEFPEAEVEYRSLNFRDFFHKHRIADMLKKVQKDGKILVTDKTKAKEIQWHQIVFKNLYEEASRFVHADLDVIYSVTRDQMGTNPEDEKLIMGPQLYPDDILAMGLRRILNTTLFSLVVLGMSLNIMPDPSEKVIMDQAQKITDKLIYTNP